MADKIQKSIEFKAAKAVGEIDRLIVRLQRTSDMLKKVETTANSISFQKFIPAINTFTKSFSKLDVVPKNIENIRVMAQALNRFRMVAVELNKKDMTVSFAKITRAIYSFTDSIRRMEVLAKTISQISELGRAINRLVNASIKLQNTKVSFTSLTQAIYAFVGSILRIKDLDTATSKLERFGNALEKIRNNNKKLDLSVTTKRMLKLGDSIKKANSSYSQMNKSQNAVRSSTIGLSNAIGTLTARIQAINLTYLYHWLKRIGETLYDLIKVYAEYKENINLATVAYRGLEQATKELYPFVEKMSSAFGLNESELIRSIGLFKQMANAMMLTEQQGDMLSKGLTKMAYDISSLYNISFDRAMSALQSSLVGQTKPIRGATGADITENTLRLTVEKLDLGKEIRDLSFVEKRLVMVISLTEQLANAQGDLARTIESPANQLKILSQQLERLRVAMGNFINVFLSQMLPAINGFVMALVEVINFITETIKALIGFKDATDDIDYSGMAGIGDAADEIIDGMEEANEKVEDLKKNMLGIDELNILEPQESESAVSGIDPKILEAFNAAMKDWDNKMDEVNMKAYAIRDAILSWFGLEKDGDTWGLKEGESWARKLKEAINGIDIDKLKQNIKEIASVIATILVTATALKILLNPAISIATGIYLAFQGISDAIEEGRLSLENFQKILAGVSLVVMGMGLLFHNLPMFLIGGIGLALAYFLQSVDPEMVQGILDQIRAKIDEFIAMLPKIPDILSGLGIALLMPTIIQAFTAGLPALKVALGAFAAGSTELGITASWVSLKTAITTFFQSLGKMGGIGLIILGVAEALRGVFQIIEDGNVTLESLGKILKGIGLVIAGIGLLTGNPIAIAIGAIVAIIGLMTDETSETGKMVKNLWETILKPVIEHLWQTLKSLWEKLKPALEALWDLIKALWDILVVVVSFIVDLLGPAIQVIADIFIDIFGGAIGFIIDIIRSLLEMLGGVADFIAGILTGDIDRALKGLGNIFVGFLNGIISIVELCVNAIIVVINGVIGLVLGAIKGLWNAVAAVVEGLAGLLGIDINIKWKNKIPQIPLMNIPKIPTFANGGYPEKGLFMMNEGNSAEMLGTINGRTAVVNNDQIAGALANALTPLLGSVVKAVENVAASDRPIVLYADSREIARASQKGSKKLGYNPIGGEFANV